MLRPLFWTVSAATVLLACESQPPTHIPDSQEIRADYSARMARAADDALRDVWWPACDEADRPGKGCGLLTDRITDTWIASFIREGCQEDPSAELSDDCREALRRKVLDSFRRRYTRARESDVHAQCAPRPDLCERFDIVELLFLESHNEALVAVAKRHVRQLEAEQGRAEARAAKAREDEKDRRVFAAVAADLHKTRIRIQQGPTGTASSGGGGCASDYDCSGPGNVCAKPAGSPSGTCARSVNRYGIRDFRATLGAGLGPGRRQCSLPSDCPNGFRCDQGRCMR